MDFKNQIRKAMTFDGNTEEGVRAVEFLEKSCGRKQGIIITLALIEFIEKYKLEGKSVDDIKQFIKNYDYINAVATNSNMGFGIPMSFMNSQPISMDNKPVEKSEETVEKENAALKDELNEIAAMFNF